MNQDTPSGTPRPRPTPLVNKQLAKHKNKHTTRAKRFNPNLQFIKSLNDVSNPIVRCRLILEYMEFWFPKPKSGDKPALTGDATPSTHRNAFKLLKQLEMKARGVVPKEAPLHAPKTEPERPQSSDSASLANGDTSIQVTPPPSEGL